MVSKARESQDWQRPWREFRARANRAGLNRLWVFARSWSDSRLPNPSAAHLSPTYQRLVLLCGGGRQFWRRFGEENARDWVASENPLDQFCEREVERLSTPLRTVDPSLVTAYPFKHPRQVWGVQSLLEGTALGQPAPYGIGQDPRFGPWWAVRGILLTSLPLPLSSLPKFSACQFCTDTPCVSACPAGAVRREGFLWRECAQYRLDELTCREDCPARVACPMGATFRYGLAQTRHHYRASMRSVRAHLAPHPTLESGKTPAVTDTVDR